MQERLFDLEKLKAVDAQLFRDAWPFPHCIVDDFADPTWAEGLLRHWPDSGEEWKQYQKGKRSILRTELQELGENYELIAQLERISGIERIRLGNDFAGGGLSEVLPGGSLGIHVDFNQEGHTLAYRRLNCFLYLNHDWRPEYNGGLELRREPSTPGVVIEPLFNRFVMFETSSKSWHGHPKPLKCPEGMSRKSLAFYYFTKERPDWFTERHSTVYVK